MLKTIKCARHQCSVVLKFGSGREKLCVRRKDYHVANTRDGFVVYVDMGTIQVIKRYVQVNAWRGQRMR